MKRLEALGLQYHTECKMCGTKKEKQKLYNLYPHPAVVDVLVDKSPIAVCVKCVKRELGTKNLEELHELEKVR